MAGTWMPVSAVSYTGLSLDGVQSVSQSDHLLKECHWRAVSFNQGRAGYRDAGRDGKETAQVLEYWLI